MIYNLHIVKSIYPLPVDHSNFYSAGEKYPNEPS